MRESRRILLFLSLLFPAKLASSQVSQYDAGKLYSKEALEDDLHFVHKNLEKIHPGIYRYTTKPSLDRFFDSLDHVITGPTTSQAFFSLLTLLNDKIRNGHTLFLPGDSAMSFFYHSGKHLPFLVDYGHGKLTIVENYSTDGSIQPGMEILKINGTSVSSIMEQLLIREVRDGYNETYPIWVLNHYFSGRYSFTFGDPKEFSLVLKDNAGTVNIKKVTALSRDSIHYFRQIRYGDRYPSDDEGQGIIYRVEGKGNTAVLKVKTFDPDLLESLYRQDYKKVLDSVFTQISRSRIENIILDLRDNQGGDFRTGQTLLSYLVLHPCRFLVDGEEAMIIQPRTLHFKGRLFVLINGGTFSSAAIVCACLKRDRRAFFIGEETGGNSHIIAGDPVELILPQTKIRAYISTTTYRIATGVNDGHGVMPDYPVAPSADEIVAGKDPSKQLALKLTALSPP